MNTVGRLLERIHEAELELSDDYQAMAERHESDQDVHHLCHTFAKQCAAHAERLRPMAERYGEHIDDEDEGPDPWGVVLDSMRHRASELIHRRPASGLVLLHDLRRLFLGAENVSILWVMAGQTAQAKRDSELLQLVTECHTETEIQVKALVTHVKVSSPQILA